VSEKLTVLFLCTGNGGDLSVDLPQKYTMEVTVVVKKCILFIVSILCLTLPQGVLAEGGVTVLFTGDLLGQVTSVHG